MFTGLKISIFVTLMVAENMLHVLPMLLIRYYSIDSLCHKGSIIGKEKLPKEDLGGFCIGSYG